MVFGCIANASVCDCAGRGHCEQIEGFVPTFRSPTRVERPVRPVEAETDYRSVARKI